MPPTGFFFCTLSVLCPDCRGFALCSYCTTHNTNVHAPGGIRTRNPSKRSAIDTRLRPLGHWDRQRIVLFEHCAAIPFAIYKNGFDHRTVQPVASRSTD